jgi:hypothetical protein
MRAVERKRRRWRVAGPKQRPRGRATASSCSSRVRDPHRRSFRRPHSGLPWARALSRDDAHIASCEPGSRPAHVKDASAFPEWGAALAPGCRNTSTPAFPVLRRAGPATIGDLAALCSRGVLCSHARKPPWNAFSLSPRRQRAGIAVSSFALPPPSTTSSGSTAAISSSTTSATRLRHYFLPKRFNPRSPTYSS